MKEQDISKELNHKNWQVRTTAIRHPNATSEHINKALNDKDLDVREAAVQHPNATSKHISKALSDEDWIVRTTAVRHPNATSDHINKALDDAHWGVRTTAVRHPNATSDHINKALNDEDWHVRAAAIQHPNATSKHINKALSDEDWIVRKAAEYIFNHKNKSKSNIKESLDIVDAVINNDKITASDSFNEAMKAHVAIAINSIREEAIKSAMAEGADFHKAEFTGKIGKIWKAPGEETDTKKVTGGKYGSSYKTDDDGDEVKQNIEVKRGRGRPRKEQSTDGTSKFNPEGVKAFFANKIKLPTSHSTQRVNKDDKDDND